MNNRLILTPHLVFLDDRHGRVYPGHGELDFRYFLTHFRQICVHPVVQVFHGLQQFQQRSVQAVLSGLLPRRVERQRLFGGVQLGLEPAQSVLPFHRQALPVHHALDALLQP